MRITCRNCGGDHPVWDCKRSATKSTAETKVSPQAAIAKHGPTGVSVNAVVEREGRITPLAGTQALPVDTNPGVGREGFPPFTSSPAFESAPDRRAGDKDDQPINGIGRVFAAPVGLASPAKVPDAEAANIKDATIPKRKVGRPKFITDLKAYKAMKQKEYRKKWKERANDTKLG